MAKPKSNKGVYTLPTNQEKFDLLDRKNQEAGDVAGLRAARGPGRARTPVARTAGRGRGSPRGALRGS